MILLLIALITCVFATIPQPSGPSSGLNGANLGLLAGHALKFYGSVTEQQMKIMGNAAREITSSPEIQQLAKNMAGKHFGTEGAQVVDGLFRGLTSASAPPPPLRSPMMSLPPPTVLRNGASIIGLAALGSYLTLHPDGQQRVHDAQDFIGEKSRELQSEWASLLNSVDKKMKDIQNKNSQYRKRPNRPNKPRIPRFDQRKKVNRPKSLRSTRMSLERSGALALLAVTVLASNFHCAITSEPSIQREALKLSLSATFGRLAHMILKQTTHLDFTLRNTAIDLSLTLITMASVTASAEYPQLRSAVVEIGNRVGKSCQYMAKGTVSNVQRIANGCRYLAVGTVCNANKFLKKFF